ncbi:MAG: hypothetical protein PHW93_06635 [Candidatus Methanomethylophilaceae archaeon]|nr:hypothetical protein [Candidatus Methanomethylophilaceae archaeon]
MALNDESNPERAISAISLKYRMTPSEIEKLKFSDIMRMYSYIDFEIKEKNRSAT